MLLLALAIKIIYNLEISSKIFLEQWLLSGVESHETFNQPPLLCPLLYLLIIIIIILCFTEQERKKRQMSME